MGGEAVREALSRADRLHARVFERAEARAGKPPPRGLLPGIRSESPRIARGPATAWSARRVDARDRRCLSR